MAFSDSDKESFDRVTAKAVARAEKRKESDARREEEGVKLIIEREPTGLYYVRHDRAGKLPNALNTYFTSIARLEKAVAGHYGNLDPLK